MASGLVPRGIVQKNNSKTSPKHWENLNISLMRRDQHVFEGPPRNRGLVPRGIVQNHPQIIQKISPNIPENIPDHPENIPKSSRKHPQIVQKTS